MQTITRHCVFFLTRSFFLHAAASMRAFRILPRLLLSTLQVNRGSMNMWMKGGSLDPVWMFGGDERVMENGRKRKLKLHPIAIKDEIYSKPHSPSASLHFERR
jgi:hypothetical protein